jgi:hypothetical protein
MNGDRFTCFCITGADLSKTDVGLKLQAGWFSYREIPSQFCVLCNNHYFWYFLAPFVKNDSRFFRKAMLCLFLSNSRFFRKAMLCLFLCMKCNMMSQSCKYFAKLWPKHWPSSIYSAEIISIKGTHIAHQNLKVIWMRRIQQRQHSTKVKYGFFSIVMYLGKYFIGNVTNVTSIWWIGPPFRSMRLLQVK